LSLLRPEVAKASCEVVESANQEGDGGVVAPGGKKVIAQVKKASGRANITSL
jgi:hypothetical protein